MSDLKIILGGVMFAAQLRDGSTDEVKVRQLSIDSIEQWASLQGDEPGLVELYCDRQDKVTPPRLRILRGQEIRLLERINTAAPEEFDALEQQIAKLRVRIAELEAIERWDSKLLPDSHDEILRIGEELNRPIFDRWTTSRVSAIGLMKAATAKLAALSPSASLPPSVASSSG